jgi:hypothetical protein
MKALYYLLLITVLMTFYACHKKQDASVEHSFSFSKVRSLKEYKMTDFVPTLENKLSKGKNSVYCITMLYAWDEIRRSLKTPLHVDHSSRDLTLLNSSKSYMNVLNKNEYKTSVLIAGDRIKAKAEFNKSLPFENEFESNRDDLTFESMKVASFGTWDKDPKVEILYYRSDSDFIIKLLPKDRNNEIILLKTSEKYSSMSQILSDIKRKIQTGQLERRNVELNWQYFLNKDDRVIIPKLNFHIVANYSKLEGAKFRSNSKSYFIDEAVQRTAFRLDERGAIVESEARIVTLSMDKENLKHKPKLLIFDKPFFIMLKKKNVSNPYLGIWIANTELMIKE